MEILAGVTLESLVVARRVAKAIYRKAELGQVDLKDFPMLVHVEGILEKGADAQHPWEAYTFDNTKFFRNKFCYVGDIFALDENSKVETTTH